jgi:hypothetical protein
MTTVPSARMTLPRDLDDLGSVGERVSLGLGEAHAVDRSTRVTAEEAFIGSVQNRRIYHPWSPRPPLRQTLEAYFRAIVAEESDVRSRPPMRCECPSPVEARRTRLRQPSAFSAPPIRPWTGAPMKRRFSVDLGLAHALLTGFRARKRRSWTRVSVPSDDVAAELASAHEDELSCEAVS